MQALIEDIFKIVMPIRTVGDYLKKWGFTPQKPVKRAHERCDKKVKKVKEWLSKRIDKIEVFYLASYSPDLNPDEYLNRDLKSQLSKRPSRRKEGGFKAQAKTEMRRLQKSPKRAVKYFHSEKIKYAA